MASQRDDLGTKALPSTREGAMNGHPNGTDQTVTHYALLGVNQEADADTLAEAYVRLREQYHPDKNPDDPLAPEITRYLDSAYAVLIDPERRRAYDNSVTNGAAVASPSNGTSNNGAPAIQPRWGGAGGGWGGGMGAGAIVAPPGGWLKTFESLKLRDFRILWIGTLFSFIGMQMGMVVRHGWSMT
jgi:hypothetical protein